MQHLNYGCNLHVDWSLCSHLSKISLVEYLRAFISWGEYHQQPSMIMVGKGTEQMSVKRGVFKTPPMFSHVFTLPIIFFCEYCGGLISSF